jgi:hypothetical protein
MASTSTMDGFAVAPTATLAVEGVSSTMYTPVSLTQTSDGILRGTVALKRTVSFSPLVARAATAATTGVEVLWFTPAPGAAPVEMVGMVQPSDGGTLALRAYPVGLSLCDPTSLQNSLTSLTAEKQQIESQLSALENSILGAELASAASCQAAYTNAINALTLEVPAAALLGDVALQSTLTGELDGLTLSPHVCDATGLNALASADQLAESELALVDVAIKAVLVELQACIPK